jgi:hypothetical protein
MPHSVSRTIAGFIAGFLAVVIFHQVMYLIIQNGLPPPRPAGTPWNMAANKDAYGMPFVINQALWGGLWGIAFAFLADRIPGPGWLGGILFGMIGPMLLGSWLIVAMVKGTPLFAGAMAKGGFDITNLRNGFLLNGIAFGLGLGLLYPLIARFMPGSGYPRN